MAETEVKKLTKKQQKALQFRKKKDEPSTDIGSKRTSSESSTNDNDEEPVKKKRKTRRGRGGKGRGDKKGNRFIVFVGSLPKDITATELQSHFKSSSPDHIRIRQDKGIAFLEFDADKDPTNIQRRMDVALLQHRTQLKGKPINVELTVGGGGNSQERLEKLRVKNEKLEEERRERVRNMVKESSKKSKPADPKDGNTGASGGVHPDRAKLIQRQ
ncbi:hypothetical protein Kpol_1041p8 [Vanderwaltozyma polyspora DSM 70294]|uniref:RRM domain-containing protein n=1 Tax=Vanderwaltozyma polyspora (strain ATCC 22028 / DSM 70294 / BCRC 21397 / CBS 2163 / NBRC 10782 / NRRL Y-8283 / UCD 57-17) TaxID=436907 RepID=A7TL75_VANPO|nr:uncharacterized protein Kpol_1041p8 [Vanderwaltozyma polyspora DSM 70294]EDO16950.1 hypothetical protein Kpol_1041p8 [Vanderwaltozyma polyspora DSM 70294]